MKCELYFKQNIKTSKITSEEKIFGIEWREMGGLDSWFITY